MSDDEQRIRNMIQKGRAEVRRQQRMSDELDSQRTAIHIQQKRHLDAIAERNSDIHYRLLKINCIREEEAEAALKALLGTSTSIDEGA